MPAATPVQAEADPDADLAPCPARNAVYTGRVIPEPKEQQNLDTRRPRSRIVERIAERVGRVFDSLDGLSYLREVERSEFKRYADFFADSLERIDRKIREGRLVPHEDLGLPHESPAPSKARLGVFIGSFDPFQMTHLAMALRFLASDSSEADVVYVVPEGSMDPRKPRRTEYAFRMEILRFQLAGVFEPLVVPLDIGDGADTIEIVRRLIAMHPGSALRLTHLMGSDTLPTARALLPEDLAAWGRAAGRREVELDFSIFAIRRGLDSPLGDLAESVRALGVRIDIDEGVVSTPSSTDFRAEGAFTVVFPTEAMLSRLELLFRYGMNKPWGRAKTDPESPPGPEYEI